MPLQLTHACLNVESIAPGAVISAVDGDLAFAGAGVPPVLPRAEILDGCGIGTWVNSVCSRPVVSAKIVILHRKRGLSTVDGWRGEGWILISCWNFEQGFVYLQTPHLLIVIGPPKSRLINSNFLGLIRAIGMLAIC